MGLLHKKTKITQHPSNTEGCYPIFAGILPRIFFAEDSCGGFPSGVKEKNDIFLRDNCFWGVVLFCLVFIGGGVLYDSGNLSFCAGSAVFHH